MNQDLAVVEAALVKMKRRMYSDDFKRELVQKCRHPQPMDMQAGIDTVLAQIMKAFGGVKPYSADLCCNKRGHRMKVLVHDGLGI